MKRVRSSVLLLAAMLLVAATGLAACEDMGGTVAVMTSLSGGTSTSDAGITPTPGQPTTTIAAGGAPAPTAAAPAPTAAAPAPTAAPPTTAPPPAMPPYVPLIRVEDGYGGLAWDGSWSVVGDPSDSGGTSRFAEYAGSSMKVYFNGTSISFITRKGPAVGYAQLELDGVPQPVIDLYNPGWVYQQQMWSSGTIGSGDHTLKVIMVGDSNPASASKGIYVDAFDVKGTVR